MKTEEEARKLWCPMARTYITCDDNEVTVNRTYAGKPEEGAHCIASDCMMWRWARKPNPDWRPQNSIQMPPRDTRSDPPMYLDDTTRGYCGIAGRPEVA